MSGCEDISVISPSVASNRDKGSVDDEDEGAAEGVGLQEEASLALFDSGYCNGKNEEKKEMVEEYKSEVGEGEIGGEGSGSEGEGDVLIQRG